LHHVSCGIFIDALYHVDEVPFYSSFVECVLLNRYKVTVQVYGVQQWCSDPCLYCAMTIKGN
jgi:hypothetical protein